MSNYSQVNFDEIAEGLELIAVGGPRPPEGDGECADAVWPDA